MLKRFLILGLALLCVACASPRRPIDSSASLSANGQPAPMTLDQGDAILHELKQIHRLLESREYVNRVSPTPSHQIDMSVDGIDFTLGRPDAPVTIVEFTDYQCPFCRAFHRDTFQRLMTTYIDTGKVRYISRDLPLPMHTHALNAAEAARCAGDQGDFWQMRDALISDPSDLGNDAIVAHARTLVPDLYSFRQCFFGGKHSRDIERDIADADLLQISATPTFVIGKVSNDRVIGTELLGAQPYSAFEKVIHETLSATLH